MADGAVGDDRFIGVAVGRGRVGVVIHKLDNTVAVFIHPAVFLHGVTGADQIIGEVGKSAVDHPVGIAFRAAVGDIEEHDLAIIVSAGGLNRRRVVPVVGGCVDAGAKGSEQSGDGRCCENVPVHVRSSLNERGRPKG